MCRIYVAVWHYLMDRIIGDDWKLAAERWEAQ